MRARLASIAFLLGSLGTGIVWLSVQPSLVALLELAAKDPVAQRVRAALPWYMGFGLLGLTLVAYAILDVTVARPLRRAEESIDQLQRFDPDLGEGARSNPGTLVARLHGALGRAAVALGREREVTLEQLRKLRAANEDLREAQTRLVASERLATIGTLAAGVAHEVGNPLSGILGYLSILKSRAERSSADREILDRVEVEVGRIDAIVRSLLDLGRPPQGAVEPVPLSDVIRSSTSLVRASGELGEVTLSLPGPGDDAVVLAHRGPLAQVLLNLFLNAAQAMKGRGRIFVGIRRESSSVLLEVGDDGPGLSPEVKERLFEPFFTRRVDGKGTGLGLAVSRHLVVSMGGALQATNRPEGGAAFVIKLPLAGA